MRRVFVIILMLIVSCATLAQDNGRTLKPNYRKITQVTHQAGSPYNLDTLSWRFSNRDTAMTIDDFRCLYYGGSSSMLTAVFNAYQKAITRFGISSHQAGASWWRYQMLLSAVWSTGDGSKRKPLHVTGRDDASLVATDFGTPLWFKIKGKRKFNAAPQQ